MSWLGLRHKGVEVLFPEEWNAVVDGLDILKRYTDESVRYSDLAAIYSDIVPGADDVFSLGSPERSWLTVYAYTGFFESDLLVQGRRVIKDGDPVAVYEFTGPAEETITEIYLGARRPLAPRTMRVPVGPTPVPLSDVDVYARRIHVKVPSWAPSIVYLGGEDEQEYILEPGDIDVFEIYNLRMIYARSLDNVEIHIFIED